MFRKLSLTMMVAALVTAPGCAPAPATERPINRAPPQAPGAVESVGVPDTSLVIDRPSAWWLGGSRGLGVVLSYIGSGDGYPAFAVQTDPDAAASEDAEREIEDLFEALSTSRDSNEVVFADWTEINGIRVHSSLMTFESVAGTIATRRLLLTYDARPYIFSWSARETDYATIEQLVEWCAQSLRLGRSPQIVAGGN